MPQISLYVTDAEYNRIREYARRIGKSVSKAVISTVMDNIEDSYSPDFFELFGAVQDDTFTRPEQGNFEDDSLREDFECII
ncbi:MAG: DUF6290 family protein [Lachnospiraceae bacterium]|nr:DUF6290 family protein [Lachnospiraceae bacterium]